MELTAATVAVRTDRLLRNELEIEVNRSVFWTDSMSVLRYINNTTSRFHTFVANRLVVIHEGSEVENWRYIESKSNPADLASRGSAVNERTWTKQWIAAPAVLLSEEDGSRKLTEEDLAFTKDEKEVKASCTSAATVSEEGSEVVNKLIDKNSCWYSLKKSVAWILKVREELQHRVQRRKEGLDVSNPGKERIRLSVIDLENAEKSILRVVQIGAFANEFSTVSQNGQVSRNSGLRKLDPVFEDGLLCVGGRLDKSSLPVATKHPIILPKNHHVSMLILRQIHHDLKHSGRNHMLSRLRERYWLVSAPSAIRKLLTRCVVCRRHKGKVLEQKMSNLPEDRIQPDEPPFTRVGVDYFGPFEIKQRRSLVKRYGVIFTCLSSRAVHIEVAHSLDTSSYINALRRFIARRGQVNKMRSDNGTNFVGAEHELRNSIKDWNVSQIQEAMLQQDIDWQFNPPAGSHHGGVWERLIRSIRFALNCTSRHQVMDDENLQTLMCEIEAILNSRPITRESEQCNDLEALTPNHLLLLKQKPNLPPGVFSKADNYCRRRWRQVQYMADVFWQRWIHEYLPLLQERQKWLDIRRNLKNGDVVLVVDSSAPKNSWCMGVIVETKPDSLGFVRQVKVKTATNVLTRPIDKLCLLLEADSCE